MSLNYDSNGNGLGFSVSQAYGCTYDDEDRVSAIVCQAAGYKSEFVHDGLGRRRLRQDFSYTGGSWIQTNLVHYVYDGRLVLQERWFNPLLSTSAPIKVVTYTRGIDRSGNPEGAGGIGGLLARTESLAGAESHAYYHEDGRGNVSVLVNGAGAVVARYIYEPFGRLVSAQGPLAEANTYRFSSKEVHPQSGLVYFGARYYDPSLQRWLNRDPAGTVDGPNLYAFVGNNPVNAVDAWGLERCEPLYHVNAVGYCQDGTPVFTHALPAPPAPPNPNRPNRFGEDSYLGMRGDLLDELGTFTDPETGEDLTGGDLIRRIISEVGKEAVFEAAGTIVPGGAKGPKIVRRVVKRVSYEWHHIFPQAEDLAREFRRHDVDIHEFTIRIPEWLHRDIHSGGPRGGIWNQAWREFFSDVEDVTKEKIYVFADALIEVFSLSGQIGPYPRRTKRPAIIP